MQTNNIKNRLERLEAMQPQPNCEINLKEKIALYKTILENEDFDSEDGRQLKATLDKYADAIAELG